MEPATKTRLSVQTVVHAPVEVVWKSWTNPASIVRWCHASDDWHAPRAENDLRAGGRFLTRMEARDGSFGFDFEGTYDEVRINESMEYHLDDGRKVKVLFTETGDETEVTEFFDAETENSADMQRQGWQAILDNFKKHTESGL